MGAATKKQKQREINRSKRKKDDKDAGLPKHEYKGRPVDPGSRAGRTVPPFQPGPRQRWLDDKGEEHTSRSDARRASKNKAFAPKLVRR